MQAAELMAHARQLLEEGESDEALAAYEQAATLEPENADAWFGGGYVLRMLGRADAAIEHFDRALALGPGFAFAWTQQGLALAAVGRYDEAIAASERSTALDAENSDVWYHQGQVFEMAGRYEEAITAYDHSLKLDSERVEVLEAREQVPVQHAAKMKALNRALSANPNAAHLWVNWFLSKEGQVAQFKGDLASPAHRDLQIPAFLPYPDQIVGHKIAGRQPDSNDAIDRLNAAWTRYWLSAGGAPIKDEP